jgi:predicted type IV restriction endonuclease
VGVLVEAIFPINFRKFTEIKSAKQQGMTEKNRSRIVTTASGSKQVFDRLRHRFVALTPEESVRQMFVDYLIDVLGYPEGLMANEISITLNGTSRRCDSVLFGRDRRPVMVIEYKAPTVAITQGVFEQVARYNLVVNARYLVVTNGRALYCCRAEAGGGHTFLERVPTYAELLSAESE